MPQNLLRVRFARTAGKVARQLAAATITASLVPSQGTATALAQGAYGKSGVVFYFGVGQNF